MEALAAELPDRMTRLETAVAEFRSEFRAGFATLRDEMRAGDEETRLQMHSLHDTVTGRIDGLDRKNDTVTGRIDGLDRKIEGLDQKIDGLDRKLNHKIDTGDEETRRLMRELHEEVIAELDVLERKLKRAGLIRRK
jgi:predicted RNase H-like nuclease (RuvC/YqgF family)